MAKKKYVACLGAGVLVMMALAGCETAPAPVPTPSNPAPLTAETAIPNDPAARQNVQLTSCKKGDGAWTASGTAKNATADKVTYHVTVSFTTTKGTVIERQVTDVPVDAGGTAQWQVSGGQDSKEKTLRCVLRGVANA